MKAKRVIIVFGLSLLLTGIALTLCFLDKQEDANKLIGTIFFVSWAFCVLPSYVYVYDWLKKRNFSEGALLGSALGVALGFFALVIPIIIAPVLMFLFYCKELRKLLNK